MVSVSLLGPIVTYQFLYYYVVIQGQFSSNLIQWTHLPVAISPDKWYDVMGAWSGSAVVLDDGTPAILYTGSSKDNVQLQNLAFPENTSDPYLTTWVKSPYNPIAVPPSGVSKFDFRDPSAWKGSDGLWRMIVGSRQNGTDCVFMYKSKDFLNWSKIPQTVTTAPGRAGMWECPDLYPVSTIGKAGLDTCSENDVCRHVLKASFDDDFLDYYAIGTYSQANETWVPVDSHIDVQNGLRYDYGKFYASKTFYDPSTQRQELKLLRGRHFHDAGLTLKEGMNKLVNGLSSVQVDMEIAFAIPDVMSSNEWTTPLWSPLPKEGSLS
ncbi:unnamed protein product [Closterium sp. Yama58-4]|nr:unnamed protein product [Closterium sp. Yama58-4]